ncbi:MULTISPECIES: imidazole glycerol phosphate synthase subunit HisH [Vibrio]|uniref:Imidazole glycerol phosphate synthase subunit HisH n=1 Tax=Vibrio anguillarum TaxID=55601 RepID=A0A191W374_VIBAN|nr:MULTISPECIES: imidazole glycerol phosphate synthase subunit HisH [Vibrio]ASW80794.1 imidazole glycerol phosphate synthase subunit HisH [Vibrio anguillarum]AXN04190.1 imidazole glycerol phosphate synthase subunit HisH [Vibrio anguillarum]AZS25998.1 imidazole glycerol phosphate synthase subunit HisH [Vibrio anguillarum]MBF4308884.1 imidazole glycerol phosphate synthase subunit HisH [Vibrio anguillarum]MBF4324374.1 imidazole glycerol phosphate synthase subunit HisH [Vibrio anguillarum]
MSSVREAMSDNSSQPQKVVIIDTGCANVSSVKFAIERLGYPVTISKDPDVVLTADKLFLPGVGTASEAMKNLQQRDLITLVKQVEKPLLGICLGMQLLGQLSEEKGQQASDQANGIVDNDIVECLRLCDGEVRLMDTGDLPLPHMGWNTVNAESGHPLFKGIEQGEYFYFVHSYAMPVGEYTIAECEYGKPFTAALQSGNYYGVQFHPERSSKAGSALIKNFLEL